MGSEMCIRDRVPYRVPALDSPLRGGAGPAVVDTDARGVARPQGCLLYTSDAADERSSVDLGGRRIIKKKTTIANHRSSLLQTHRMQQKQ